jgi:ATP-binding cassette subfamily B protein
VLNILADPISISPIPINNAEPLFRREIALSGIGFHYDNGAMALTDIDLTIAAGQRVGLVGRTGSGKSTLVDVLMGLLEPSTGAILLDGVVLTTDRVSHWQAQIAHVPQTIFLADDSLAANISLGDAIDQNRIENAARGAHIHDFIVSLPKGYETRVGERGIHLSGGQRQRIGIARALYRRADVLVFDEATSALDDETETSVMASVDSLEGNLTVIMIAHRLSTLRNCDVIYRLENGRIVERGDYQMVVGEVGTAF